MTIRKICIVTSALCLLATAVAAAVERPANLPRIGILSWQPLPHLWEAFRQGLRDLGYVEGQNIIIEGRDAGGKLDRLPGLAAELVRLKVDVVVAPFGPAPLAAKSATSTIPIVFLGGGDPVGDGLVASLARPGGNITGLSAMSPEIVGKQLQLLKETVPKVSRVAVLRNPGNPTHPVMLRQAEGAARALGTQLQTVEARGPNDFESAFSAMARERAGALLVLADLMFLGHRSQLAALAAKSRLPAVYGVGEHAEAGGLMAYGANRRDMFRRAATYVDKILKGAKPADLPVEQPTRFELVVNLKTAKALGLTIPRSVLSLADEVIQ